MDMDDEHGTRAVIIRPSEEVKGCEKHSRSSDKSTWEGHGEAGGFGAAHLKYHAGWEQDTGRARSDFRGLHAPSPTTIPPGEPSCSSGRPSLGVINSNRVANLERGVAVLMGQHWSDVGYPRCLSLSWDSTSGQLNILKSPGFNPGTYLLFALFLFGHPSNLGGWPGLRWLIGSIAGVVTECHEDYVGFAQGYHNDLEGIFISECIMRESKVSRSYLERRLRFMCQNSRIECLFGVASLALSVCWAPARTEEFELVRDFQVSVIFFSLSTIVVEYV